jgi:hypothetical protein
MYKFSKAEILENGVIQLRQIEVLKLANGTTVDGRFRRIVYTPDMDINSIECIRCKALATVTWTSEVVADYKAKPIEADLPAE